MITQEEYLKLKELYKHNFRWIARDKSDSLYVFKVMPMKFIFFWAVERCVSLPYLVGKPEDNSFAFIKWEDEEPTKILDLMQDYESHQIITGENTLNDFFGTDNFNIKYVPQFQDLLSSLKKDVEKEKLYTVKLANGDCLYKFKDIEVGWTNGYSNYENDPDFQLTQSEIESVDPVLMKIAKEVE